MESNENPAPAPFPRIRTALLIGGSLVFALILLAAKKPVLEFDRVREAALVARNLADGRGYTTDILVPRALSNDRAKDPFAETRQPPGHPLLLAGVFLLFGPSDLAVIIPSLLAWMACAVTVFFLGVRLGRPGAGLLGALLILLNVAGLKAGLYGLHHPFLALLMLLFTATLIPPARTRPAPPGPGRSFSAGLLLGLLILFQPLLLAALLPLPFLLHTPHPLRPILRPFFGGFLAIFLPCLAWALFADNSPFPALFFHHLPTATDYHPDDTLWRMTPLNGNNPFGFPFLHPRQTLLKAAAGLSRFWQEGPVVFHPLLLVLALTTLFDTRHAPPTRRVLLAAALGLLLFAPVVSLFEQDVALLLVWVPLFSLYGAASLIDFLRDRINRLSPREDGTSSTLTYHIERDPHRTRRILLRLSGIFVLLLCAFPLAHFILIDRGSPAPDRSAVLKAVDEKLSPDALILTDEPAFISWETGRRTVWLPVEENDWDHIERNVAPVDAAWVGPDLFRSSPGSRKHWWVWLAIPQGVVRGLHPVSLPPGNGFLRLREGAEK